MTNTVVKTLTEAKTLLIEKGWTTGDLITSNGCMCALGAIGAAVVGEQKLREREYDLFNVESESFSEEALEVALVVAAEVDEEFRLFEEEDSYDPVWRFNDRRDSQQATLDLFDRVIANHAN